MAEDRLAKPVLSGSDQEDLADNAPQAGSLPLAPALTARNNMARMG